jgi:cytochrome P450
LIEDWNPFDPEALRDPAAMHAVLRAQCPVAHTDHAGGFWALFKYDDIVAAARDPQTFSSHWPRYGVTTLPLKFVLPV